MHVLLSLLAEEEKDVGLRVASHLNRELMVFVRDGQDCLLLVAPVEHIAGLVRGRLRVGAVAPQVVNQNQDIVGNVQVPMEVVVPLVHVLLIGGLAVNEL